MDERDAVTLYDLSRRREVGTLHVDGTSYRAPAFSPDGERLAVSAFPPSCWYGERCDESAIAVFDAHDLRPLDIRYEGLGGPAADVAFSPSGALVAAALPFAVAAPMDNVAIWEVDEPDQPPAAPDARRARS